MHELIVPETQSTEGYTGLQRNMFPRFSKKTPLKSLAKFDGRPCTFAAFDVVLLLLFGYFVCFFVSVVGFVCSFCLFCFDFFWTWPRLGQNMTESQKFLCRAPTWHLP